tara:strand:+ start:65510 stop:65812 length:303 start_codon:yes stop_codon:yes gene_type:complete
MSIPQAIIDDLSGLKRFPYSDLSEEEITAIDQWREQALNILPAITPDTWETILPILGYDLEGAKQAVNKKRESDLLPSSIQSLFLLEQLNKLAEQNVRFH